MSGFSMVGFFRDDLSTDGFSMEGLCLGCLSMGGFTMDGWFIHWQFDHQRTRTWRGAVRDGSAVLHGEHQARGAGRGEGLGKKAKGFRHGESTLQKTITKCSVTIDTPREKHPTKHQILKENPKCRLTIFYSTSHSFSFKDPNQQRSSSNSIQEAITCACGEGALSAEPALLLHQANADFTF